MHVLHLGGALQRPAVWFSSKQLVHRGGFLFLAKASILTLKRPSLLSSWMCSHDGSLSSANEQSVLSDFVLYSEASRRDAGWSASVKLFQVAGLYNVYSKYSGIETTCVEECEFLLLSPLCACAWSLLWHHNWSKEERSLPGREGKANCCL